MRSTPCRPGRSPPPRPLRNRGRANPAACLAGGAALPPAAATVERRPPNPGHEPCAPKALPLPSSRERRRPGCSRASPQLPRCRSGSVGPRSPRRAHRSLAAAAQPLSISLHPRLTRRVEQRRSRLLQRRAPPPQPRPASPMAPTPAGLPPPTRLPRFGGEQHATAEEHPPPALEGRRAHRRWGEKQAGPARALWAACTPPGGMRNVLVVGSCTAGAAAGGDKG